MKYSNKINNREKAIRDALRNARASSPALNKLDKLITKRWTLPSFLWTNDSFIHLANLYQSEEEARQKFEKLFDLLEQSSSFHQSETQITRLGLSMPTGISNRTQLRSILEGAKYLNRYGHLTRACPREVSL